tara:strand:- start:5057 stop:5206 length:150 start_codon:yes stop_codon:yes gene_type:complete
MRFQHWNKRIDFDIYYLFPQEMYQNNIFEPVIHADASQILASSSFYSYR